MRAHSDGGDDDGGGGDDADERFREDVEAGEDNDDIPIRPLGKTGGRGRGRNKGVVRGRSVGRGGRGGVSDNGGKFATYWSAEEQMQLVRCKRERGAGAGESVGSEAAGEGFPEERSSTRDSDNNAASGAGGGKRKNVRQQALDSIADVMDRHGELMSSTIESSSKRQCSIFTRQCDILEQEVAVQKAHYAASDETQRMMCHALMEIVAAIRVFSPRSTLAGVVVLLSTTCTSSSSSRGGQIFCVAGVSVVVTSSSRGGQIFCLPRARRRRHATAARETCFRETYFSPGRPHFPLIRSHCQACLQRSPRNMSTRGNTRGKKRDVVPDDSQGQGRGRRQAPKAKRVRSEDASARVPLRGAQGWAAAAEGDYDEEFRTEEEQAEATTSEVRKSGRQRSSDHTASKRMLTPPPEAQQLRGCEMRTEKVVVVDLGGEDVKPLDRRQSRVGCPPRRLSHVSATRVVMEGPSNAAPEGKSWQTRAVGAEAAGAAGAGGSGTVAPVATAREEAAVVATTREEARGEKKGDREAGEPDSSRVSRGVMTKDLIDRVVLWVDDKAFRTMGEGQRLYNIVHDTREYFVAIASGFPPPAVPRSVVLPKSNMLVGRIVDQSQLQQAISRAAAVENVVLRILHGWVFKSRNRPRGYHVAFQYSLESFATDIARAMWYGEEWCDVVSPAVCVHTIDLSMDLPLWFADSNIEERPDDDDMAAHQESTVICVAHAFRAAVQMGALIDGEFISHDHLCRVADCFRLLLAAFMWIIRMVGDDSCSHYEAFYFANLVAKPTLVAAMHRSFDHRRSVVRAAKAVTERLGKANATFGEYPDYIPQWAPCGIGCRHDASRTRPEDAKKLDCTDVGRIVDQSQLQQAISRAAAVENVALRILHGWVFKSGNRPRGYHVAFQYSLESFATDIARAMW
ncbi:hypothetical protein CBR_g19205 [Chara braunii]|uniref:Uncharacterized protein n=1 Tax=Chara braunii TaxID=69332 RepID=A0A388JTJ6_CHABU|nr:hypothetical protein CBR_g19205 [Chara braunii]|eukprot:GBG61128.1 hypothetical protein CBR_g19205 [Chara braunii]